MSDHRHRRRAILERQHRTVEQDMNREPQRHQAQCPLIFREAMDGPRQHEADRSDRDRHPADLFESMRQDENEAEAAYKGEREAVDKRTNRAETLPDRAGDRTDHQAERGKYKEYDRIHGGYLGAESEAQSQADLALVQPVATLLIAILGVVAHIVRGKRCPSGRAH